MIQEKNTEQLIYSRLASDPDLADIVEMFVDEIPGRLDKMMRLLDEGDMEELRRSAHQIKGSAGSYGFEPLSPVAHRVEDAVRNDEPEEQIRQYIVKLSEVCSCIRAGCSE